jgi:hypothetical protein
VTAAGPSLRWLLAVVASLAAARVPASDPTTEASYARRDLRDVVGLGRADAPVRPARGRLMLFAVPTVAANPTVGLSVGVGASAAILLGNESDTTVSSFSGSAQLTTERQVLVSVKSLILTPGNEWELLGDLRLYDFAESTFGLGTASPTPVSGGFVLNGLETAALPGAQPLRYFYLKVHETIFRRIWRSLYAGVGYHLDVYRDVEDLALDLDADPPVLTSHRGYSLLEGFDPEGYTTSGLSIAALWETRDHTLDPHRGLFLQLSWRMNREWLGSARSSDLVYAEARAYVGLPGPARRHLLAFWSFAEIVAAGRVPYLTLPSLGNDTRGRSGRGYTVGRWRGTGLVYGEAEWRFPLTRDGLVGGVAFLNATTAARPGGDDPALGLDVPAAGLFESVKLGGGAGLRLTLDRRARMNLAVDYAVGAGGSNGFYLAVGEAF